MQDEELIEPVENCTLPAQDFHHRDHVKLAWLYLKRHSALEALEKFSEGIKRFAAFNGKATRYHETITWAFIFLINERMASMTEEATWQEFAESNADLLDWQKSILKQYYRDETLQSELARRIFLLPDRAIS
jgi:hypothetical protein